MRKDIFDLNKNRMTTADRVSIAKKVIKESGMHTANDLTEESFLKEIDLGSLGIDKETLKWLENETANNEEKGHIIIVHPIRLDLDIRKDVLRFRIKYGDDEDKSRLKDFYDKFVKDSFVSYRFEDEEIDYSIIVPQVADKYFECYFKAMLLEFIESDCYISDAYNNYKRYMPSLNDTTSQM